MSSSGGKHTCIEKDIEIVPLEKIVTVLPQDTFGISKILDDYRVETTFQKLGDSSKIARETQATLKAATAAIEAAQVPG